MIYVRGKRIIHDAFVANMIYVRDKRTIRRGSRVRAGPASPAVWRDLVKMQQHAFIE